MADENRVTTEDIFGDFGFRVRWSARDYLVEVEVFNIIGRDQAGQHFFERKASNGPLENPVADISKAQAYLTGSIKWDGCSHIDLQETHFCGLATYKDHIRLLHYLYIRAFELMGRNPEGDWPEARAGKIGWERKDA